MEWFANFIKQLYYIHFSTNLIRIPWFSQFSLKITKFNTSSSFAETQKLQTLAQKERKRWGIFLFSLFVGVDCFLCNISTFCGSFVNVYFLLRCVLFPAIFLVRAFLFSLAFFFYSSFSVFWLATSWVHRFRFRSVCKWTLLIAAWIFYVWCLFSFFFYLGKPNGIFGLQLS